MDLRRVRVWEWLTGLAGLALLTALLLPWYGGASGWEALSITDVVLAVTGLACAGYVVVTAAQRTAAVPQTMVAFVLPVSLLALILTLVRVVDAPAVVDADRGVGVWLALAAAAAAFAFSSRSMGDKRFPPAMRPKLEITTIPTPTPDGERRDVS